MGFGRTFTATDMGQQAWFAALSTWLTDDQAAVYRDVSTADIPVGRLIHVELDHPENAGRVRALLTYDNGMVLGIGLVFVCSRGTWLVASITPLGPPRLQSL